MKIYLLFFATALFAVAAAAEDYKLSLFYPSFVGSDELKPGNCKLTVDDGRAVFKQGRKTVEADVQVETGSETYKRTSVRYKNGDGKYRVSEIQLGGTSTKLVFN